MKTAVLYARYSSDKQREASIDDQLRVCRDWCASEGIEVVGQYTDYAISGKSDNRPEFRRMIANAPESDYVVVYMFDRFSRDRYDSAMYKKTLRDLGVKVLSASERVDDTPEGGLQEGLLEILSEYYVRDLARKIRRGMEGNALKAKDNGYRIFGYRTDPATRRYVIEPVEAEVVRRVFASHIAGESTYSIAKRLASEGWTTATGKPVEYNWVCRMLKRRCYTGLYSWAGIEVEGGMPVIIDDETFERAQRVPKRKPRENEYWSTFRLTGKLYCARCGELMHGAGGTGKKGKRYYYYACREGGGCDRPWARRDVLEGAVADAVLDITSDEEKMRMVARRVIQAYDWQDDRTEIESVEGKIAALEKEQHRITQAVMKGFVNDEIVARNDEIKEQLEALRSRHGILMSEAVGITEDDIVRFLMHGFDRTDEDFIFGSFVNRVYLYDDFALAMFNFRDEDGDLAQERVSLELWARKNGSPEGFPFVSNGVPTVTHLEPVILPHGFALVIAF